MSGSASSLGLASDAESVLDECLVYQGLKLLKRPIRHLSIYRLPSFDPSSSWTLFKDEGAWHVRRIVLATVQEGPGWAAHSYGADGLLEEEAALGLLKELSSLSVSAFETHSATIGIDGMRTRVKVWRGVERHMALDWWGAAPERWTPLRDFVHQAIETMEAALPSSTHRLQVTHPWVE